MTTKKDKTMWTNAAEVVRLQASVGPEPPEPLGFGKGEYTLPVHSTKLLERINAHERDAHMHFYEIPHVYTVDGRAYPISVTGVVAPFCEEFDEAIVIGKMKNSRAEAWPKLKYAVGAHEVEEIKVGGLYLAVENTKTVFAGAVPEGKGVEFIKTEARRRYKGGELSFYRFERPMTDEEISASWEDNRTRAANAGTHAHHQLELWANSEPCNISSKEVQLGLSFVASQLAPLGAKVFRTEWEIYSVAEKVAGSVDLVLQLPDTTLIICDWKRATDHAVHSLYKKKLKVPLDHIDDTAVAKFAIQLGIYKYILEKNYGYRVRGLVLCGVEPNNPFHTWVPFLKYEIEFLMSERRKSECTKMRVEMEAPGLERCALSGDIAWDPVRVDGTLYDRKEALVHLAAGTVLEDDVNMRKRIGDLAAQVSYEPSFEENQLVTHRRQWVDVMPEHGIPEFLDITAV